MEILSPGNVYISPMPMRVLTLLSDSLISVVFKDSIWIDLSVCVRFANYAETLNFLNKNTANAVFLENSWLRGLDFARSAQSAGCAQICSYSNCVSLVLIYKF